MSAGAHWVRAALQVNPFSYEGRNAPKNHFPHEAAYNIALLDECETLGIKLIAITDHWRVDSAAGLIEAAASRGVVALPGFEANSSEGIHVLVLFEANTPFATINAAIGRCDANPGCDNGTVGAPYATIMERMTATGALAIPAHTNTSPAGLLTTRSGQPLAAMIQHEDLHAIGITPAVDAAKDQQAVVDGTGIFERVHPLAVVHADDVMGPRQLRTAGASSWFKVSSLSLESLKLAVRTPQTRVSLDDPVAKPRPSIKSVAWVGGYLDGISIPVSADLTALIGGRGAGKSTVIESIRYALDIKPISKQMAKDHQSMVDHVLNAGTIVRVEVESVAPTSQRFVIEREVPHPPVVLDAAGERTRQVPADVIGPVEVFGQHELAELASDSGSIAALVRRFDGSDGEDPGLATLRVELRQSREDLKRAEDTRSALEAKLERADRLQEQVSHYEKTDVPAKLAGQQRLSEDEAVFTEGSTRVSSARTRHDSYLRSTAVTDLSVALDNVAGAPQSSRLERVSAALATLHATLSNLGAEATAAFEIAEKEITSARDGWQEATVQEKAGYGEVLRELTEKGLEPAKFVSTKAELTTLKASKPRLTAQELEITRLIKRREDLLGELRTHETRATEHLHAAVRVANDATSGVVVVRPTPASDREHIIDVIKGRVSGARTQIAAAVQDPGFSPRALADAIRGGIDALSKLEIRGGSSGQSRHRRGTPRAGA